MNTNLVELYEQANFSKIEVGHNNLGSNYTPDEQQIARMARFYRRNGIESTEPPKLTYIQKLLVQPLEVFYPIIWERDSSNDTDEEFALKGILNILAGNTTNIKATITNMTSTDSTSPPSNIEDPTYIQGNDVGDIIVLIKNTYSSFNMSVNITANKQNQKIHGSGIYAMSLND